MKWHLGEYGNVLCNRKGVEYCQDVESAMSDLHRQPELLGYYCKACLRHVRITWSTPLQQHSTGKFFVDCGNNDAHVEAFQALPDNTYFVAPSGNAYHAHCMATEPKALYTEHTVSGSTCLICADCDNPISTTPVCLDAHVNDYYSQVFQVANYTIAFDGCMWAVQRGEDILSWRTTPERAMRDALWFDARNKGLELPYNPRESWMPEQGTFDAHVEAWQLDVLKSLPSMRARVQWCNSRLKKLGMGSSRCVYLWNVNTVLKLAYNRKGIAQNGLESDGMLHRMYDGLVTRLIYADHEDRFLLMEKASDVKVAEIEKALGVELHTLTIYFDKFFKGREKYPNRPKTMTDFADTLMDLVGNFDLCTYDLGAKSAWGKIGERIVLRDFGLSHSIWTSHYCKRR